MLFLPLGLRCSTGVVEKKPATYNAPILYLTSIQIHLYYNSLVVGKQFAMPPYPSKKSKLE